MGNFSEWMEKKELNEAPGVMAQPRQQDAQTAANVANYRQRIGLGTPQPSQQSYNPANKTADEFKIRSSEVMNLVNAANNYMQLNNKLFTKILEQLQGNKPLFNAIQKKLQEYMGPAAEKVSQASQVFKDRIASAKQVAQTSPGQVPGGGLLRQSKRF